MTKFLTHAHDYNEPTNRMWCKLGLSWRAPSRLVIGTGHDH